MSAAPSFVPPCRRWPSRAWSGPSATAAPLSPIRRRTRRIARAAAERLASTDIAAFRERLHEEQRLLGERGPNARRAEIHASGDFHLLLASVAGNAILLRFMEELVARSSLVIALYGRSGASSCGHDDHDSILAAIEARDGDLAAQLLLTHIDHIEADLDLRITGKLPLREALAVIRK